ncbi:MAG: hypothetical protein P8P99_07240 [Maricaulis sp.]|nr:hypothetical protein [Maricaulis sp.]
MTGSQYGAPRVVSSSGSSTGMARRVIDKDDPLDEKFVQDLLHDHPDLLPMVEIEPDYRPVISVCRELGTDAGFIDNLFVTPSGGIILAECKLMKNPQMRREVIAQTLDYTASLQRMGLQELEAAISKTTNGSITSLWSLVSKVTDLDENEFNDAVTRNLRRGRILGVIVGEGMREETERLVESLQLHAGLHTAIALVELSLWKLDDGSMVVMPRVPMKTNLIQRAVIDIRDGNIAVREPDRVANKSTSGSAVRGKSLTEAEFFERMEEQVPGLAAQVQQLAVELEDFGVTTEFAKTMILRWRPHPDMKPGSLGYIHSDGKFDMGDGWAYLHDHHNFNLPELAEQYLQGVSRILGGKVRRYQNDRATVNSSSGKTPNVSEIIVKKSDWFDLLVEIKTELEAEAGLAE